MTPTLRTSLLTFSLTLLAASTFAACTHNPEGSERRRRGSSNTPAPGAQVALAPPIAPNQPLPEGHPPVGAGAPQGAPSGGPPPSAGGAAEPDAEGRITVAGIQWQASAPLTYQTPSSQMRAAQYGIEGGDAETVLTVFHFPGGGGGIQENIDRWVGQMRTTEERPPETSRTTVAGLAVTKIDVHGGFGGMQMPGAAPAAGSDTGHRMLGAIVEGPNGPVFFKVVGPEATVDLAAEAFDELIASFRAAP